MDVALEDDLFFADLNRRISLLIMDEDDGEDSVAHCPFSSKSLQVLPQVAAVIHQHQPQLPPETCFYYGTAVSHDCQREIRGTGVFIPRSSTSSPSMAKTIRRKNKKQAAGGKAGRTSSSAGSLQAAISYKKLQPISSKSSRVLSQLA